MCEVVKLRHMNRICKTNVLQHNTISHLGISTQISLATPNDLMVICLANNQRARTKILSHYRIEIDGN